jgi:hypothetical protein
MPTAAKSRNGQLDRVASHSAVATTAVITVARTAILSRRIPAGPVSRRNSGCRSKPTTLMLSRITARTEETIASTRAVGCRLGSDPAAFTSNGLRTTNIQPTVPATEPLPAHHGRFRRPASALTSRNLPVSAWGARHLAGTKLPAAEEDRRGGPDEHQRPDLQAGAAGRCGCEPSQAEHVQRSAPSGFRVPAPDRPPGVLAKPQHRGVGGEQPAEPNQGKSKRHPASMRAGCKGSTDTRKWELSGT